MSSVRGCDNCGRVFFESEENWSTGMGSQFYTDEKGRRAQREKQEDRCGECNGAPKTVTPNLGQLTAPDATTKLELDEMWARIQELQANAGKTIPGSLEP